MTRVAIDPVTRAGGPLRIEAEIADGVVAEAWVSGTSFRGIESVVRGRDPRDAWLLAERVCGSCSGVHALASVRAVERAFGVTIPTNARLVRNVMTAARFVQDHVAQLYVRALPDWADRAAALRADPADAVRLATRSAGRARMTSTQLRAVQDRMRSASADGASLGPPGPWGHPAFRLSPEADLVLWAHAIEALDWQRSFARLQVLLGGKDPHPQTFVVGGMALAAPWGGPAPSLPREHPIQIDRNAPWALSADGIAMLLSLVAGARTFVDDVLVPDTHLIVDAYRDWIAIGRGPGDLISFGEFPDGGAPEATRFLPAGRILDGSLGKVEPVEATAVLEDVSQAWYKTGDGSTELSPAAPPPEARYTGPAFSYETLAGSDGYTWVKAPRYLSKPMETGPLARMLVASVEGREVVAEHLGRFLEDVGLGPDDLFGTIGRMVARAVEAQVLAERLGTWVRELETNLAKGDLAAADISMWDPATWPGETEGWSLGEGPRGAVGHWVSIRNGSVDRYGVVDASTWNLSPRDADGRPGPIESALVGVPVADPARPIEAMRVLHAVDPCAGCATHLLDPAAPAAIVVHPAGGRA